MKIRSRARLYNKGIYILLASSIIFISLCLFILINLLDTKISLGVVSGDYRSAATGNWNAAATWEKFNGSSWVAAVAAPTSADGVITIQNGHTITVTANVTVDEVTVDAGGALTIATAQTLTIGNGTGNDLTVNGTLTINGTLTNNGSSAMILAGLTILKNGGVHTFAAGSTLNINSGGRYRREDASLTTSAGIITVNSGGVYQHNMDGQSIPLATWNTGSLCEITGVTVTKPGNLNQTFYSFTWNSPNQTSIENLTGMLTNIDGDLTFVSTGTGTVRLGQPENYNLTIVGNYYHQGGTVYATAKSLLCTITVKGNFVQTGGTFAGTDAGQDNGEGSPTINVEGDFNISAGTFDFNQSKVNSAGKGITTLNLYGNYSQTGGTVTETATLTGRGDFNFTKSGTQYFSKTSGTLNNTINFKINSGAIVDVGNSVLTGAGTFTLLSGGGLNMGSADGITQSSALGNVQVTGTRSYSTSSDYTYNGLIAQVSGDGLPATVNKLTINNSNHVTLTNTASISNTLTFTSGNFITSSDTLIVGTSISILGSVVRTSGHVVGYLKRWIAAAGTSNILFPVGSANYYEGMNYSFTIAPSAAGSITTTYTATNPGKSGFNLWDSPDSIINIGYALWTSTMGNGLTGGTFSEDITATALPSVIDYTALHLLRRANSGSAWTIAGIHSAGTGSNAIPVIHRTGMTVHGQFGIGSGSANPLPIKLIYFNAKLKDDIVKLTWATASELNNDFFTVEHSSDGIHFEEILRQRGAGNSSFTLYYTDEDLKPLNGYNFYRLKQTDYDGHFTYSDVETVKYKLKSEDEPDLKILSVIPNPFSEKFYLNFSTKSVINVDIMLINSSGQVVTQDKIQTTEGYNTYEFTDNYNLNKGIYFINLLYKNQHITQKVIKN